MIHKMYKLFFFKRRTANIDDMRNFSRKDIPKQDNLVRSRLICNLIPCVGEYETRRVEEGNGEKERAKDQ